MPAATNPRSADTRGNWALERSAFGVFLHEVFQMQGDVFGGAELESEVFADLAEVEQAGGAGFAFGDDFAAGAGEADGLFRDGLSGDEGGGEAKVDFARARGVEHSLVQADAARPDPGNCQARLLENDGRRPGHRSTGGVGGRHDRRVDAGS